jgi:hypothetical protein
MSEPLTRDKYFNQIGVLKYKIAVERVCLFTVNGKYGERRARPQFRLSTDAAQFPFIGQIARVRIP